MKLINRKTGQIVVFGEGIVDLTKIGCKNVYEMIEAGWEDYKEPERYYYIDRDGHIVETQNTRFLKGLDNKIYDVERAKSIGNIFTTQEEAKKAVEKLKAWKRLKDKGFKFNGKTYETDKRFGSVFYEVDKDTYSEDIIQDLDLLFGDGDDEDEDMPTNAEINDLTDMGYGG